MFDGLKDIEPESIDCVVTSPPYWQLRDYGDPYQIGLEPTRAKYIERIQSVFRLVHDALKPEGTLWLNIGDTYMGGRNGGTGRSSLCGGRRNHEDARRAADALSGPWRYDPEVPRKNAALIPQRVAIALQDDGWIARSEIIWHKPTAMPESVRDRPTRAHETIFLFSKSERYYYDADAARESVTGGAHARGTGVGWAGKKRSFGERNNESFAAATADPVSTRNWRSVWTIQSSPTGGAHTSTFPRELARRCIVAGCPPGGMVMDPFAGSGTTGAVALGLGRSFFGIELVYGVACRNALEFATRNPGLDRGPRLSVVSDEQGELW